MTRRRVLDGLGWLGILSILAVGGLWIVAGLWEDHPTELLYAALGAVALSLVLLPLAHRVARRTIDAPAVARPAAAATGPVPGWVPPSSAPPQALTLGRLVWGVALGILLASLISALIVALLWSPA